MSYKDAMSNRNKEIFKKAMSEEFDSVLKNETWQPVDKPEVKKNIGLQMDI